MLPIKYTSGDRTLICPYDKTHVILAKSLNAHLIKCRQNHTNVPMAVCRFDKTHVMPKPEKAHHESECPSQYLLDRERQRRAGDIGLRGDVKGPPIVADHNSGIDTEDWGACPPVRTPALFNKRDPEENAYNSCIPNGAAPYFSGRDHGTARPNSPGKPSHGLPLTSSLAASVAQPSVKVKQFPSSVFEYTSGYGRGRGKALATGKENALSQKNNRKTQSLSKLPEKGQFEDKQEDKKPPKKQVAEMGKSQNPEIPTNQFSVQFSVQPSIQPSVQLANNESQLKAFKEGMEQIQQQMQQLKLLHREEHERMKQDYQLQILQFEQKFAENQRLLFKKQAEQEKSLEERLMQVQQLLSSTKAFATYSSPPGFSHPVIPALSTGPDIGASNTGPSAALPVSEDTESWHEDAGGMSLPFGPSSSLGNAASVTTSGTLNNVANWLQQQPIRDEKDHKSEPSEAESPSDPLKTKRKFEKKLRQITVLEQKVSLGHKLSSLEEEKLNQKAAIISQLATLDCSQP